MRCIGPAGHAGGTRQRGAGRGTIQAYRGTQAGGIVRINETPNGNLHEIRVAQVFGTITVSPAHSLDDQVYPGRLIERLQLITFEDVQHGSQGGTAGRRRRRIRPGAW